MFGASTFSGISISTKIWMQQLNFHFWTMLRMRFTPKLIKLLVWNSYVSHAGRTKPVCCFKLAALEMSSNFVLHRRSRLLFFQRVTLYRPDRTAVKHGCYPYSVQEMLGFGGSKVCFIDFSGAVNYEKSDFAKSKTPPSYISLGIFSSTRIRSIRQAGFFVTQLFWATID